MFFKKFHSSDSFISYLTEKNQKLELLAMLALYILVFVSIQITYPYPAVTADTGNYILSAKTSIINGYRPMGYSWLIQLFHLFSENIKAIFIGQFIINCIAQLSFIFSVKYFFQLKNIPLYLFSLLFILSPSIIFCTNYIMSDSIFNSLTLLYLTTALWIIKHPNLVNTIFHFIVLYLTINVRYAALFYPILSIVIFILHSKKNKLFIAVALVPLLIGTIIYFDTKSTIKKTYDIEQFSAFGGWALANNAVSIIPHIYLEPEEIENEDSRLIHKIITRFPDSTYSHKHINATDFMWKKNFPGKNVLYHIQRESKLRYTQAWMLTGNKFKIYGSFLIKNYPIEYFKYYIFPNCKQLFYSYKVPNVKKYVPSNLSKGYFNLQFDRYDYKYSFLHKLNPIRKIFIPLLWILFFGSIVVLFKKKLIFKNEQTLLLLFLLIFFLTYVGFSIIAHPINNFRYLIPIYCIQLLTPIIVLNKTLRK